ncbi:MAG: hypothetical protein KGL39_56125 [Patescibacteria group bacterium]|nr:hypothetical protein [Patescibacteria group bacterium]
MKKPTVIRPTRIMPRFSIRQVAQKHGVSDKTLYATLNGTRPGNNPRVQRAVEAVKKSAEALANV